MNKKEKQFIINYLQKKLDESEKMWVEGVSRPQIVGFLQEQFNLNLTSDVETDLQKLLLPEPAMA